MFRRVTNPCQCRLFVQRRAPFEANPGKHWVFKGYNLLRGVRNVRKSPDFGNAARSLATSATTTRLRTALDSSVLRLRDQAYLTHLCLSFGPCEEYTHVHRTSSDRGVRVSRTDRRYVLAEHYRPGILQCACEDRLARGPQRSYLQAF